MRHGSWLHYRGLNVEMSEAPALRACRIPLVTLRPSRGLAGRCLTAGTVSRNRPPPARKFSNEWPEFQSAGGKSIKGPPPSARGSLFCKKAGHCESGEPLRKNVRANASNARAESSERLRPIEKLTNDEQGPATADKVERGGDHATLLARRAHRAGSPRRDRGDVGPPLLENSRQFPETMRA